MLAWAYYVHLRPWLTFGFQDDIGIDAFGVL